MLLSDRAAAILQVSNNIGLARRQRGLPRNEILALRHRDQIKVVMTGDGAPADLGDDARCPVDCDL
jgi:hypothetical protein